MTRQESITTLLDMAAGCFAAARYCPSEADIGEEYLAAAEALAANQGEHLDGPAREVPKRQRRPSLARPPMPGGLLTAAQAAERLGCSPKTLNGHVTSGALRYVAMGHGRKRPRKMFTDADLTAFIEAQTRKDAPSCPSIATRARRSGNSIFGGEVIAFTAQPRPRPGAKPKK